jgi:hypothetical protein
MRQLLAAAVFAAFTGCALNGKSEGGSSSGSSGGGSGSGGVASGGSSGGSSSGGSSSGNGCAGTVTVTRGLLAGGAAGTAMAASAFYAIGPRVVLAATNCALLSAPSPGNAEASVIRLNFPPGIAPGTYEFTVDGGAPLQAWYAFTSPYYGGEMSGPAPGSSVTLTAVDPTQGVQGSYHLDFGGSGISGGGSGPDGGVYGTLGELVEDGTFVAPVCTLCALEPEVGPSPAFGDAGLAACDAYYAAQSGCCGGPSLPAAEAARQLARFEQVCQNEAALPGSGITAASLAACASALGAAGCDATSEPAACLFHGALPADTACNDGVQCQSGDCVGTTSITPEGPFGPYTCGFCAPGAPAAIAWGPLVECPDSEGCSSGSCSSITWASSGEPCGSTVDCLVGTCDYGGFGPPQPGPDGGPPAGVCPTIIADGQTCTNQPGGAGSCDAYSECFEGACVLQDGAACE